VPQPAITTDVHQPLDVHLRLLAKVAFDHALLVNDRANAIHFVFAQLAYALVNADARFFKNLVGARAPNAVDVCQTDFSPFICREVYTCYACHSSSVLKTRSRLLAVLSLPLFMLWVRADHAHHPSAVNDLAVITHFLY
jgi:hypothetical protein